MSSAVPAARVASHRRSRQFASTTSLTTVKRIGYTVFGIQLLGFLIWSAVLYQRFAVTFDFSIYHQAWYLIAHGTFNPLSTVTGHPFWQNHSEFIMWPVALLYWVYPHGVTLLWLQDLSVVSAELIAFLWACEIIRRQRPDAAAKWLAGLTIVLTVLTPWIWWTVSFDFHSETLAVPLLVLVLRDLVNGRRRAWIWVIPLLACGDVAATYLAGAGLGGVLAGRQSRLQGALMAALGVSAVLAITLVHGNVGSGGGLQVYAYLAGPHTTQSPLSLAAIATGIITHPLGVVRALWAKRVDLLANLAPAGVIGLLYPPTLPTLVIVALANTLFHGLWFASPIFQNLPIYVVLPVGTVAIISRLRLYRPRLALVVTFAIVIQSAGWTAAWAPRVPNQWLRVSPGQSQILATITNKIPATAEVISSEGVMGRFAERLHLYDRYLPGPIPVAAGLNYAVIAPSAGVEIQDTASAMAFMAELADREHATVIAHADGVWAFRWVSLAGVNSIWMPGQPTELPAWVSPGSAGNDVIRGSVGSWHVQSNGREGYLTDGIAWEEPTGSYLASVVMSMTGPVNVEVWDDAGNVLLARRSVPAGDGIEKISLPVSAVTAYRAKVYSGWGPFRAEYPSPPASQRLEIRVWSPGGEKVNIYSAGLAADG